MLIAGLTGSIGMGKSAAAVYLASKGIPVFDSDAAVHKLYAGEAVPLIEAAFPGVSKDGQIVRNRLAAAIQGDAAALQRLEAIVHPMVASLQWCFLEQHRLAGAPVVVFDIPLLFETGGGARMDAVIVVSAPAEVQYTRVLSRAGMTPEKFANLLARQMPDEEKRWRADYIVNTGGTFEETHAQLDAVMADLQQRIGTAYERWHMQFARPAE
jgi:dephospho-CoA kinase